jgi:hypothetical protein
VTRNAGCRVYPEACRFAVDASKFNFPRTRPRRIIVTRRDFPPPLRLGGQCGAVGAPSSRTGPAPDRGRRRLR